MISSDALLGRTEQDAVRVLEQAGMSWTVQTALPKRPLEGADSRRVVRVRMLSDGIAQLTICECKTQVSQG